MSYSNRPREVLNPDHVLRYKSAEDIIGSLRDYILTNTDKLNDFSTGSALETLVEAIATELETYYYLSTTNIKGSIDTAVLSEFNMNTSPAVEAYGTFIIHFNEPLPNALQIPSGTQFSSSNPNYGQMYRTHEAYTIPAGTQAYAVQAVCTEGGEYGNIPARVIDRCDNFPQADSIVNPQSISTGANAVTAEQLKPRFRQMIQALQRGTVQAVQWGAFETSPLVKGAFVDESVGYVRVYCHDANGDLPAPLQKKIQQNMVNWRPAGIPVEILPCHKSIVEVGVTLDVPNQTLHTPELLAQVKTAITKYINSRQASQDLVLNHIVSLVMSMNTLGINNCQVALFINPDPAMVTGATVNSYDNIIINEHIFNKDILAPKDRAEFDDYIHTPGDRDNPPYASNLHGDGYITADIMDDTQDTAGDIDNNLDNSVADPEMQSVPDLYEDAYNPMLGSLSVSASNAGYTFDEAEATSYINSYLNTSSGINAGKSVVADSIINSLSTIDNVNGISFNADSASSMAASYVNQYSSSSVNSASASASSTSSMSVSMGSNYTNPVGAQAQQNNAQIATAVSAGDAQPNKSMRVLNKYLTRGNEILRCGNVVVNYNNLSQFNR